LILKGRLFDTCDSKSVKMRFLNFISDVSEEGIPCVKITK